MKFIANWSTGGGGGTQQPSEQAPSAGDVAGDIAGDTTTQTDIQKDLESSNIGTMDEKPVTTTNPTTGETTVTWTVDVTNNEVPVATVAQAVVSNVLSSVQKLVDVSTVKSAIATSADNPTASGELELKGATTTQINEFGVKCLQVAETTPTAAGNALADDAITESGDLVNKTATIKVVNTPNTTNGKPTTAYYAIAFTGTPTQEPGGEDTPTPDTVAVYRFYNTYDHTHLYTTDLREVARLNATEGWKQDGKDGGIYWYAPKTKTEGCVTILRFYNPYSYDHYYCPETNTAEIAQLKKDGWIPDSAASNIYSAPKDSGIPVYTLFNPYADVDTHLYTPYMSEVIDSTQPKGWWEQHSTYIYAVSAPAL